MKVNVICPNDSSNQWKGEDCNHYDGILLSDGSIILFTSDHCAIQFTANNCVRLIDQNVRGKTILALEKTWGYPSIFLRPVNSIEISLNLDFQD